MKKVSIIFITAIIAIATLSGCKKAEEDWANGVAGTYTIMGGNTELSGTITVQRLTNKTISIDFDLGRYYDHFISTATLISASKATFSVSQNGVDVEGYEVDYIINDRYVGEAAFTSNSIISDHTLYRTISVLATGETENQDSRLEFTAVK